MKTILQNRLPKEKIKTAEKILKTVKTGENYENSLVETAAIILAENPVFVEIYQKEILEKNPNKKPEFEYKINYKMPEKRELVNYISFWTKEIDISLGGRNLSIVADYLYQKTEK